MHLSSVFGTLFCSTRKLLAVCKSSYIRKKRTFPNEQGDRMEYHKLCWAIFALHYRESPRETVNPWYSRFCNKGRMIFVSRFSVQLAYYGTLFFSLPSLSIVYIFLLSFRWEERKEAEVAARTECVLLAGRNFPLSIFRTIKFVYKPDPRSPVRGVCFLDFPRAPPFPPTEFLQFRFNCTVRADCGAKYKLRHGFWHKRFETATAVISSANMVSSFISARVARNKDLRRELGRS